MFNATLSIYIDFAPAAKQAAKEGRGGIVHFEISLKNINKVVQATAAVAGDITENLAKLLPLIESSERAEWFAMIDEWKAKYPWTYTKASPGAPLKPQQVIEELDSIDPIINNIPTNSNKSKITQDKDSDLNITT